MLQTDFLSFSYPGSRSFRFEPILLASGESMLILGASGTGKSTWLQLLAGQRMPSEGKVMLSGKDLYAMNSRQRDRWCAAHIGFVFQEHHFIPSLSAFDNLRLQQNFPIKIITEMAERLGLSDVLRKKPQLLSQGEKQRLAILRALLPKPSLVLADEPSSSLDDANCHALTMLLKEQCADLGTSLLIVTHDQRLKDTFERRLLL